MERRAVAAWGAGWLVVVGAAAAALINELHGGWGWWVAASVVVVVWAVGTGWLAFRAGGFGALRQGAGSVYADRIGGSTTTKTTIDGWLGPVPSGAADSGNDGADDVVGDGAVRARIIEGDASTRTHLRAPPLLPETSALPGHIPASRVVADHRWALGLGAVGARTIKGPVTTTVTIVGGVRDRLVDAIFDSSRLYEVLGLARFTGRARLIARIDSYIGAHRSGYVLVRAEAGVGKSTLAAYLVDTRGCAHHFTSIEGGRSPEQARRSIAAQLIGAFDLVGDLGLSDDFPAGADRPDWLIKVLRAAARRRDERHGESPLVLVVDGLDEADPPAPGQDTGIPLGLPRPESLPDEVFIVATSRYGPPLAVIRDPDSWHTIDVDGAENLADIRQFLTDAVGGDHPLPDLLAVLARQRVDPGSFVDTLTDRCGGVWIYLRYVLEDIRAGRRAAGDVATLPEGLAGYYLEQVQRWRTASEQWYGVGLPALATLVALRRPASSGEVARFAKVSDDELLRGWLDREFRSFLDLSRTSSRERRYAVRHQSFRDLFDPPVADDDRDDGTRDALHRAVIDAHRSISVDLMAAVQTESLDGRVDDYIKAELAAHVTAAGLLDEWSTDPDYLLACNPWSLLRLRAAATTREAHAALAAYELSLAQRSLDPGPWWLHVWARKTRCHRLAERAVATLNRSWIVTAAMWSGASHRTLTGYTDTVWAVCAVPLPDGRTLLATGSDDKTVRLWDPTTAQPVGEPLTGHTDKVRAVCAVPLPDGRTLLATGSFDGTVRLWDPTTAQPVGEPLTGHTDKAFAVCAVPLPDGRTLLATGSFDGTVRLWDPTTAQPVGEPLTGHTDSVLAVCAVPLPDGHTLLATGSDDKTVRLWDPTTAQPVDEPLTGHTDSVYAVCAVSLPDGRTLLATSSGDEDNETVRLWDLATAHPVGEPLTGHTDSVRALCAVPLPDGRTLLAIAGSHGTRLWDLATARPVGEPLTGHTGWVFAVCAVPLSDGRTLVATSSNDGTRLWDPATVQPVGEPLTGHTDSVLAVCAVPLPDGRTLLASSSSDETVRLWDPTTAQPVGELLVGYRISAHAVCAVPLPDGRTLLATSSDDDEDDDETVRLWDPITAQPVGEPLTGHDDYVEAVCAVPLPNGRMLLATGSRDETVRLWDPTTAQPVSEPLTGHDDYVEAVCAVPLPNGRMLLATGSRDKTVRLWDPTTAQPVGEPLTGHTGGVGAVCAVPLPDGRTLLATGSDDKTVRLWDPTTAQPLGEPLTGHTDRVRAMCAVPLPDGRTLVATGSFDKTVRLWDPTTAQPLGEPLTGHDGWVRAVCAVPLPDGRTLLASGSDDRTVLTWECILAPDG